MTPELIEAIDIFENMLPERYIIPFKALRSQLEMSLSEIEGKYIEVERKLKAAEELSSELANEIIRLQEGRKKDRYKRFGATSEAHQMPSIQTTQQQHEKEGKMTAANYKEKEEGLFDDISLRRERTSAGRQSSKLPEGLDCKERDTELEISHCPEPGCGFPVRSSGWKETPRITASIKYKKVVERYERYECKNCSWSTTAPRRFLARKCSFDTSFLAETVSDKFFSGMPYYRQKQAWQSLGIKLTDSAVCRQVNKNAKHLEIIAQRFKAELKKCTAISIDETRLPAFDTDMAAYANGAAWVETNYTRTADHSENPIVLFQFTKGKSINDAKFVLQCSPDVLVSDGNPVYSEKSSPGSTFANCNAHARRRFVDASKVAPNKISDMIIELYEDIYRIEKEISWMSSSERLRRRRKESKPIFEKIKYHLESAALKVDPKSTLGDAISYFLKHEEKLKVFLGRGDIEIDNNAAERAIRRIAIIRKNSLHAGSEGGAQAWMCFSSLVATSEANRVCPRRYLHWLYFCFDEKRTDTERTLEERTEGIMPWDFKKLEDAKDPQHVELMKKILQ